MKSIVYTKTDEAPFLATHSLLPIIQRFCASSAVEFVLKDISLAGRILAAFPERLSKKQQVEDALAELGKLATTPEANIIKLPNISASVPQLKAAIAELQGQGYPLPDYPETPTTEEEKAIKARYDKVKGSAVNPVLREGNSDRRAPKAVKEYAKAHPHSMGAWAKDSQTAVATMQEGDFYHNEQSVTLKAADTVRIELLTATGKTEVLKEGLALQEGEIIDATVMSKKALLAFYKEQFARAKSKGITISKKFLPAGEKVLIIDDFLASGEAAMGLAKLVQDAGDEVVGMAIAIEKSFQPGRERLENAGYRVESLVRIKEFKDNGCVFIED